LLFSGTSYAETKNFCDDSCNLKYCSYTCCQITTDKDGNLTGASCNSSVCCAHPKTNAPDQIAIPPKEVKGPAGFVRFGLLGVPGLKAADIVIKEDAGTKTITLSGDVGSESQQRAAESAARRYAKGYRVSNKLKVARAVPEASAPNQEAKP
jgi:hypothetical protein